MKGYELYESVTKADCIAHADKRTTAPVPQSAVHSLENISLTAPNKTADIIRESVRKISLNRFPRKALLGLNICELDEWLADNLTDDMTELPEVIHDCDVSTIISYHHWCRMILEANDTMDEDSDSDDEENSDDAEYDNESEEAESDDDEDRDNHDGVGNLPDENVNEILSRLNLESVD
jgi:cobalamin biosynthesis protein CobT